jgi:hypothetical protein
MGYLTGHEVKTVPGFKFQVSGKDGFKSQVSGSRLKAKEGKYRMFPVRVFSLRPAT